MIICSQELEKLNNFKQWLIGERVVKNTTHMIYKRRKETATQGTQDTHQPRSWDHDNR